VKGRGKQEKTGPYKRHTDKRHTNKRHIDKRHTDKRHTDKRQASHRQASHRTCHRHIGRRTEMPSPRRKCQHTRGVGDGDGCEKLLGEEKTVAHLAGTLPLKYRLTDQDVKVANVGQRLPCLWPASTDPLDEDVRLSGPRFLWSVMSPPTTCFTPPRPA
jgi:hypothetical protein